MDDGATATVAWLHAVYNPRNGLPNLHQSPTQQVLPPSFSSASAGEDQPDGASSEVVAKEVETWERTEPKNYKWRVMDPEAEVLDVAVVAPSPYEKKTPTSAIIVRGSKVGMPCDDRYGLWNKVAVYLQLKDPGEEGKRPVARPA
ncbi:hypothetical protein F5Y18DRAFT_423307 [Xylariaceae sp. FL1019]|nr:hypothetical protein F5Y18DRAFT_423307 [Xylariaceae sp. FL1019]